MSGGPDAPSPGRRLFDGMSQRSGRLLSPVEAAREAGLLAEFGETGVGAASADEVETLMNSAHCAGIVRPSHAFDRAARMPGAQVRFAAMPGVRRLAHLVSADSSRSAMPIGAPSTSDSTARC